MEGRNLLQSPDLPKVKRPIVLVGAGGIVRDAHLPAYAQVGFPVAGITDLDRGRAEVLAGRFGIPKVFASLDEAIAGAPTDVVYDVAVPAGAILDVLPHLPRGAVVLIQKPMGENLDQARRILALCRERGFTAAVNFQLRFAPFMLAARNLIDSGAIGELHGMEVRLTINTPWQLWDFLFGIPRVEIVYHSIHYFDLIRSFFGDPSGVYARTVTHPEKRQLASTRTVAVVDYGDDRLVGVWANHDHAFGRKHQESYVKWEGTRGAIKVKLGLLLDYPKGEPDEFEYCILEDGREPVWQTERITGSWFPEAFVGTMASLQRFAEGSASVLPTSVEDAIRTMALVEAAYQSSAAGATPIPAT